MGGGGGLAPAPGSGTETALFWVLGDSGVLHWGLYCELHWGARRRGRVFVLEMGNGNGNMALQGPQVLWGLSGPTRAGDSKQLRQLVPGIAHFRSGGAFRRLHGDQPPSEN
jgi:hypothetical protein